MVGKFTDYNQYANDHVLLGDLGSNHKKKSAFSRYMKTKVSKDLLTEPVTRRSSRAGAIGLSYDFGMITPTNESPRERERWSSLQPLQQVPQCIEPSTFMKKSTRIVEPLSVSVDFTCFGKLLLKKQ